MYQNDDDGPKIVASDQPMYQNEEPTSKKEKKGSFFGKILGGKKPSIEATEQPLYQNDEDQSGKKKKVFAQSSKKPVVNDNDELYEYSNELSKNPAPAEDIYGYDNESLPADKQITKKSDAKPAAKAIKPVDGEEIYGYDNAIVPTDKLPNAAAADATSSATGVSGKADYNEGQELYGYDNDKVPENKIVSPPAAATTHEPTQPSLSSYSQQSYNDEDEDEDDSTPANIPTGIFSFSSPVQVTETKKARDPSPDSIPIDPATVLPAEAMFPSVFATRRAFNVEKKEITVEEARLARAEKAKAKAAAEAKKKAEQLKYEQEQEVLRQQGKVVIKAKKNSRAAMFEPQVVADPRAAVIAAKNAQPVVKAEVKPVPKSSNPQEFDVSAILKNKSAAEAQALEEQQRRDEELRVARDKAKLEAEESERRKQEREALKRSLQAGGDGKTNLSASPVKVLQNTPVTSAKPGITLKPTANATKASAVSQSAPAKQLESALAETSTDDSNIDPKKIKKESSGKGTLERIKESFNTIRRKKMRQGGAALERLTAVMPFNDPRFMLVDRGEEFDIMRRFPDGTVSARRVDTGETGLLPGDVFIAMDSLF